MAYFFKANLRPHFFDPVSRVEIKYSKPVMLDNIPHSSYFRNALRGQWISKCTEDEYNTIMGITPPAKAVDPPKVSKAPAIVPDESADEPVSKAEYMAMTKKEILDTFNWMDEEDLEEASKKNKSDMIDFLMTIDEEYND